MSEGNPLTPSEGSNGGPTQKVGDLLEQPRSLSIGSGVQWLTRGFQVFKLEPLVWALMGVTFIAIMIILSSIPIVSLLSNVISPVLLAGFYLACRDLQQGKEIKVAHIFAGFQEHVRNLITLGVLYTTATLVIIIMAGVAMGFSGLTSEMPLDGEAMTEAEAMALLSRAGGPVILALVLMIPLTMAYVFAPQLIVFHGMPAFEAMKFSYRAALRNLLPFLVFGLLTVVLAFFAALTFGLGFIVLVPLMSAAMYLAYTEIFLVPVEAEEESLG